MGSLKRIEHVASLLMERAKSHQVVAVLSAMSGETDHLMEMAQHFSHQPCERELDVLLSAGEQKSVALMAICLHSRGAKARSFLGDQVKIETDREHTRARIQRIEEERIRSSLRNGEIVLIPGFQGVTEDGDITTLGRGGSDTSAVAVAAALKADRCEIFTDVEGVYTTDPNLVPEASKLARITYDEMLELASLGAKVLQTRSVEFAKNFQIPVLVRSSFKDAPGTWVVDENYQSEEVPPVESLVVSGISYTKNEAKVVVEGMPDRIGLAAELFSDLGEQGILVDVIVQNRSETAETLDLAFTVLRSDLPKTLEALEKMKTTLKQKRHYGDPHISKVSVVGSGMRAHAGVAAQMFRCLAENEILIQMISTSEIKTSCVIDEAQMKVAVQALHQAFGLEKIAPQEVNDFR